MWSEIALAGLSIPMLLLAAGSSPAAGGAEHENDSTYTNPVGGEIRMGDPFVMKHGRRYYLYGTAGGRSFSAWTSTDLVHWEDMGQVRHHDEDSWGRSSFWAPEAFHYDGRFYLAYSAQRDRDEGFRLCLAAADGPEGPFEDIYAPWCDVGWSTIDAHVFVDDDGTPYLYFAKVGVLEPPNDGVTERTLFGKIYGMRLKEDLSAPAGEPVLCVEADQPWEELPAEQSPINLRVECNEGAFVLKHDGRYYMTYSAGHYASPRYGIGYAVAEHPLGPWTKPDNNPLAVADPEVGVSGPGHNSITSSPDGSELFVVYHAHADPEHPSGRRTVNIDRLVIEDGRMRMLGPTRSPQPMPSGAD